MSTTWAVIVALGLTTAAIRASGPVLLGGRRAAAPLQRVIGLIAPALLAALVVTETLAGDSDGLVVDERAAGVAAAGAVVAMRGPMLVALALAAAVTAVLRAIG